MTMSHEDLTSVSRRHALQVALLAGLGATLPRSLLAAQGQLPLITKAIPATGEKLPVIGIGTNQFGRAPYNDVRDILKRMYELGGTVIDTAAMYGESEVQIGKALNELGLTQKMYIVTKLNAPGAGPGGAVGGMESFQRSMQRLGKIDLLFVHSLSSVESMMPLVLDLKKQGRIRTIGISTTQPREYPQLLEYMRKYPIDVVQVNYALGGREVEAEVLPLAQQRKMAVMAAQPFGGGRNSLISLAGKRQLPAWAAGYDIATWGQYFLKYVVSHPAITCAIPGSTKLTHLEDNQAAGLGRLPDAAGRKKMEDDWAAKV
jgi:aryl-alcohol dehydrogenase-like predicted oxidoreductase